jgi:hypothetical protein
MGGSGLQTLVELYLLPVAESLLVSILEMLGSTVYFVMPHLSATSGSSEHFCGVALNVLAANNYLKLVCVGVGKPTGRD